MRQFDLYPQVYQEAVRRVVYIANIMHIRKVRFKPVSINNMVSSLKKALIREGVLTEEH